MAWTTPKTWSAGETLTAANFNTHIRDNLLAINNHVHVRKTADQSVTSSTALVDDTHLTFAIAANEEWIFQLALWQSTGAGGMKFQMTGWWYVDFGITSSKGDDTIRFNFILK